MEPQPNRGNHPSGVSTKKFHFKNKRTWKPGLLATTRNPQAILPPEASWEIYHHCDVENLQRHGTKWPPVWIQKSYPAWPAMSPKNLPSPNSLSTNYQTQILQLHWSPSLQYPPGLHKGRWQVRDFQLPTRQTAEHPPRSTSNSRLQVDNLQQPKPFMGKLDNLNMSNELFLFFIYKFFV